MANLFIQYGKSINQIRAMARFVVLVICLPLLPMQATAGSATINLKEADIEVFIETVSRLTGKTFIIDPRVRNKKITVISQHPMDEDEIFALFLSVLKVHQFAAVETNGIYKIEQAQSAKQDSVDVYVEGGKKYSGDELITRVIKVDNVDVGQLVPLLRVLVPQTGHMAQYKPTNVIVIHDTAANLERIVKIIRQIDKESNQEIEVIPLEHASASEVVRILQNLDKQSTRSKGPSTDKPKYVADERTNSILLSADRKSKIRLRALIAKLDAETSDNGNTKVIYLKYAKAEDLATLLEGAGDSIAQEEGKKPAKSARSGNNKPYSIKAHAETNALVITAAPDVMRSFESVIRQLDIRRKQVHVEAIIVEISDSKVKELGVQWATDKGLVNFTNSSPSIAQIAGGAIANRGNTSGSAVTTTAPDGTITTTEPQSSGDNGAALGQVLSGVTGALLGYTDGETWAGLVKALASDTDSNVLSTPSLTTMDNEEALISIGQEIPIITGSALGQNNSNPFQTVDRKDVGVKLKITPQINEGDAVRLSIEQEVSSIAGATGADIVTNKRQIQTTVLVKDGQTIVLGGLIDDDVQESAQKVPLLGDIPILGKLFSSSATTKIKRNLMVFIRPSIISDDADAESISSRKYNYMRAQQLNWQERGISLMPFDDSAVLPKFNESLVLPPSYEDSMKELEKETSVTKPANDNAEEQ